MKQTAHLYDWFRVTTVLLDDFNGTFSACLRDFMAEKCREILQFSCPEKDFLLCPSLEKWEYIYACICMYDSLWVRTSPGCVLL